MTTLLIWLVILMEIMLGLVLVVEESWKHNFLYKFLLGIYLVSIEWLTLFHISIFPKRAERKRQQFYSRLFSIRREAV